MVPHASTIGQPGARGGWPTAPHRRPFFVRETPSPAARGPRLLDQVRQAIRTRHYSPRTEKAYVGWIRRYILFHGKRHPRELRSPTSPRAAM